MKHIIVTVFFFRLAMAIAQVPAASNELTSLEQADIQFLIWEEKFARDIYTFAAEKYGNAVFTHKISAEQHHWDLLEGLTGKRSGIPTGYAEFTDPVWMKQFNDFRMKADASLTEAFKTGALIEEQDIADLEKRKMNTTNQTVISVYDALISASEQHLRSFLMQLDGAGIAYSPQVLSAERLTTIRSGSGCCAGSSAKCGNQPQPGCSHPAGKGGN